MSKKKIKQYNKRTWLNPKTIDSTGSIVAFDGQITDFKGKTYNSTFIEIADCQTKIRLHKVSDENKNAFINKLELLKNEIDLFISHLKKQQVNE